MFFDSQGHTNNYNDLIAPHFLSVCWTSSQPHAWPLLHRKCRVYYTPSMHKSVTDPSLVTEIAFAEFPCETSDKSGALQAVGYFPLAQHTLVDVIRSKLGWFDQQLSAETTKRCPHPCTCRTEYNTYILGIIPDKLIGLLPKWLLHSSSIPSSCCGRLHWFCHIVMFNLHSSLLPN